MYYSFSTPLFFTFSRAPSTFHHPLFYFFPRPPSTFIFAMGDIFNINKLSLRTPHLLNVNKIYTIDIQDQKKAEVYIQPLFLVRDFYYASTKDSVPIFFIHIFFYYETILILTLDSHTLKYFQIPFLLKREYFILKYQKVKFFVTNNHNVFCTQIYIIHVITIKIEVFRYQ